MIHAIIGVWHFDACTYYVQRSWKMGNYPGVWSLLSKQFTTSDLPDPFDLDVVKLIFEKMSEERLYGETVEVIKYLSSANCADNPMNTRVFLHMYEIAFKQRPRLNSDYYIDSAWLSPQEYETRSVGQTCGLCLRMYSDYCVKVGLTDKRFAPAVPEEGI